MNTHIEKLKIFMASPDDLQEERKVFGEVVEAINRSRGSAEGFHLDAIIWEKYAYPEADTPQAIVNRVLEDASLVIVAFWNKFGAPTTNFPSGTMEEFSLAYEKRNKTGKPSIKIYFRLPESPTTLAQNEEIRKILEFKESIKDKALYKEYTSAQAFKDLLHEHINAWLSNEKQITGAVTDPTAVGVADPDPVCVSKLIGDYVRDLEKKYDREKTERRFFGLKKLDYVLGEFNEQNLTVVAGEASSGKTTLLVTAANIVATDKTVLFISPRLNKKEIVGRLISNSSVVALNRLKSGNLQDQDWTSFSNAAGRLHEKEIYIDDHYELSIPYIRKLISKIMAAHGVQLVIIDGLNYILNEDGRVGQSLRVLSREFNLPIIGALDIDLISLRAKAMSRDKRPCLRDLDTFGDLRSESDVVIFSFRDVDVIDNDELIVAKNNNGPIGAIKVKFLSECNKFEELN